MDFCLISSPYHLSKMTNTVSTEIQYAQHSENSTRENTNSSEGQFSQQRECQIKAPLPFTTHKGRAVILECNSLPCTPYLVIGLFSFLWFTAKTYIKIRDNKEQLNHK